MKSLSDYPWAAPLQAGEESFNQWRQSKPEESFLVYCLNKKAIKRKDYFDWASEFYSLPVLDHMFFESSFMKKEQWEELSGLAKWREDLMPVWVWNDVVFVGCLEPPEDSKKWTFKRRLVLVTDRALKINWKTMNRLAKAPAPPEQQQHSEGMTVTNFILKPAGPQNQQMFTRLWAATTSYFFSCMILKNRAGNLFPFEWTSGISADLDKSRSLVNLSEHSLFKVTSKGFPYHGLAAKNEGNESFFKKIGWSQLPKHVTAVPIKNQVSSEIEHVFLGLSKKTISDRKIIKRIELAVFDFFNSRKEKNKPAA